MHARQRLLDALAEVERRDRELVKAFTRWFDSGRAMEPDDHKEAKRKLFFALHDLLPTLAALREVVEKHKRANSGSDAHPQWICVACVGHDGESCEYPCPTLRTLTRQFEEEPKP